MGEAKTHAGQEGATGPGRYPLKGKTYLWDMLVSAGGFTYNADLEKIKVIREGKIRIVNLKPTLETGDRSNDILLQSGDIVYIPRSKGTRKNNVFTVGDVRKTGSIPYTENLTAFEAITISGGLTSDATQAHADIIRRKTGEHLSMDFDYASVSEEKDIILQPNDVVHVKAKEPGKVMIFGGIQIKGNQGDTGPGKYTLKEPIPLLEFIIAHGGFAEDSEPSNVTVTRKSGKKINCDVYKVMSEGDQSQNLILQAGDTVYIPVTKTGLVEITILGAISKPGIIYVKEGLTVLEAITRVGGVVKGANLRDTRLVRADGFIKKIDLHAILKRGDMSENITLQNKDVFYVPKKASSVLTNLVSEIMPLLQLGAYSRMLGQ